MKENRHEQVSRDFIHLSQEISQNSCSLIPYELIVILEACVNDPSYKNLAEVNIIAYLITNEKVRSGLKYIVEDTSDDFTHIRDIAGEFLDKASSSLKNKL